MLALGISGGIVPCPSALVVLLGAVSYHQVGLGLLLIVAFSVGLATVLTGIGLAMVYGRGLLARTRIQAPAGLLLRLPMLSALAVSKSRPAHCRPGADRRRLAALNRRPGAPARTEKPGANRRRASSQAAGA